jgi:adenine-specific DNA-methyltransferase
MANGFKTNAAFFKLGFLDRNSVALGRQFKEMLPTLWMKAGAIGPCPALNDATLPEMLVLPENKFAVLLDERYYLDFVMKLDEYPEIKTVYIVTDSDAGYRDMIMGMEDKDTYQLYRDYLDNFRINSVRR